MLKQNKFLNFIKKHILYFSFLIFFCFFILLIASLSILKYHYVSGVNYKFYVSNDPSGNDEEMFEVMGNQDETFTFDNSWNNVYCYGKEVDDFHLIDKQKIFALNFSATQEIDRIQQQEITKVQTLQTDISNANTIIQTHEVTIQQQATTIQQQATTIQQQSTKITTLETQIADILTRLSNLENTGSA